MDYVSIIEPIWKEIGPIIINFAERFPIITSIILILGTFRLSMKPIMSAIEKYVLNTASKKDDKFLNSFKNNIFYKIFVFFLDWAVSIKLPK